MTGPPLLPNPNTSLSPDRLGWWILLATPAVLILALVAAWFIYLTGPLWIAAGQAFCTLWPPGWKCL